MFFEVRDPIESTGYANAESVVVSRQKLYVGTSGAAVDRGSEVFVPPYSYSLDPPSAVKTPVENGAGTCASQRVFRPTPVPACD